MSDISNQGHNVSITNSNSSKSRSNSRESNSALSARSIRSKASSAKEQNYHSDSDCPEIKIFSKAVRTRMKHPQRASTRTVYQVRLRFFWKYCKKRKISRRHPSQAQVADFFQHLFLVKGLLPQTITGYKTSQSSHYSASVLDLSTQLFTNLIKSYYRDKPVSSRVLHPWNLSVVLDSLKRFPFEPLSVATIKILTLKTVFLISLATGRRRSEIRAISFQDVSSSIINGNTVYSLPLRADFMTKNQLASSELDISKAILVPSLKQTLGPDLWKTDDKFLCPVRALKTYLKRTKFMRRKRELLFLPYSPNIDREIASSTISGYIVQAVKFAYSEKGLVDKLLEHGVKIKAHHVRSAASSWAFLRGKCSLQQLMNACFWRAQTTFSSHYLKDHWTNEKDDHFALTPFVAAGTIIQPE